MAWITPVITWVAGNGIGFNDLNRIEGDLTYLREETATFNGAKTFTGDLSLESQLKGLGTAILINPNFGTTTGAAYVGINRNTNTSSSTNGLIVYLSNGTSTSNHFLRGTGDSYLCGNNGELVVGGTSSNGVDSLQVSGSADFAGIANLGSVAISLLKPTTIDGGGSASALTLTTSGSATNSTIIQENTHGVTSGRLETRYKQAEETNFWNVGLDSTGDYKIATNPSGNMDSGVAFAINKSTGNILLNTIVDDGANIFQARGNGLFDGSSTAVTLKMTNSGLGLNNTFIQENTNGTTSGRLETRYKQTVNTNFWNVGLSTTGNYTIATNSSGNMDTGKVLEIDKATRDVNFTSHVNPTTTPTESTITLSVAGNIEIPRGIYDIKIILVGNSGAGTINGYLEKYIDGAFEIIATLSRSSLGLSDHTSEGVVKSTGLSTGAGALRIRYTATGIVGSFRAELAKG